MNCIISTKLFSIKSMDTQTDRHTHTVTDVTDHPNHVLATTGVVHFTRAWQYVVIGGLCRTAAEQILRGYCLKLYFTKM